MLEVDVIHPAPNEAHLIGLRSAANRLSIKLRVCNVGRLRPGLSFKHAPVRVLCFGPWDYRFPTLAHRTDRSILYTSWPVWDSNYTPRLHEAKIPTARERWRRVLESDTVIVAGTAKNVTNGVQAAFCLGQEPVAVGHTIDARFHDLHRKPHSPTPTLGFVSRAGGQKGLSRAVEVLKRSCAGSLIVAGEVDDKWNFRSPDIDLRGRLDQEQMVEFVRDIDVLLLPSSRTARWEELFGMAAAESMAAGRPVIATAHEGPLTLLRGDLRRYAVAESSFGVDGAEMVDELANDSQLQQSVGDMAKSVASTYHPAAVADRWVELLQRAIKETGVSL